MWTYKQSTGELFNQDSELVGVGYAGFKEYANDPSSEQLEMKGPLPKGVYIIGSLRHDGGHMGRDVMFLNPNEGNTMYGRSAFYMHGDNGLGDRSASNGCIVMPHDIRWAVANSGDTILQVIE
jgi:hypothetical protein